MKIRLTAYGIAKDILSQRQLEYDFDGLTISQLKTSLVNDYPEFDKLRKLSFAVAEEYRSDEFMLSDNVEVVIIPPVSGG